MNSKIYGSLKYLTLLILLNPFFNSALGSTYSEVREKCRVHNPLKMPLFGDIHVHTSRSLDASTQDVRTTPYQAYQFAQGKRILLHPWRAISPEGEINPKNSFLKRGDSVTATPNFKAKAQRSIQLGRPLDFAMVSDHAEFFGEVRICNEKENYPEVYKTKKCRKLRENLAVTGMNWIKKYLAGLKLKPYVHNRKPLPRQKFCGRDGEKCLKASELGWKEVIDAAEAAYDKTSDCKFTSFIGYEYTLSPLSGNLHRNVLFRNKKVPKRPVSVMDAKNPEALWDKLTEVCLQNDKLKDTDGKGCDVIAIPHNSNISNGRMFSRKVRKNFNSFDKSQGDFDKAYAKKRIAIEPLIEIYQHKGDSECHFYKPGKLFRQRPIIDNADEFCNFEKIPFNNLMADKENMFEWWFTGKLPFLFSGLSTYPEKRNFVRHSLKRGLQIGKRLGVNPFKYGFIGSTDTHIGAPGSTNEMSFKGHGGAGAGNQAISSDVEYDVEGFPKKKPANGLTDFMSYSGGGLAAVWSEENSRDFIFEAMRRKETYATSGTRILLRFFGGWEFKDRDKRNLCNQVKFDPGGMGLSGGSFVEQGYKKGVPMGGDLPKRPIGAFAPTFAVAALKDPGNQKGKKDQFERSTPLQQIQIIKGWMDKDGKVHEKVYSVAGNAKNGARVDLNTCKEKGPSTNELCTLWTDPDFKPGQKAFYYARVLENPVCRWSWYQCVNFVKETKANITPEKYFSKHCLTRKKQRKLPEGFRGCCLHKNLEALNPKYWEKIQLGTYDPAIQERAWSSPIWYNKK